MLQQLGRFVGIGSIATTAHVITASLVNWSLAPGPFLANSCGYLVAILVSYLGHTRVTFSIQARHGFHFPRFLFVSLTGLAISSFITWWGVIYSGLPFVVTMLFVAAAVPTFTFLALKLWALKEQNRADD